MLESEIDPAPVRFEVSNLNDCKFLTDIINKGRREAQGRPPPQPKDTKAITQNHANSGGSRVTFLRASTPVLSLLSASTKIYTSPNTKQHKDYPKMMPTSCSEKLHL